MRVWLWILLFAAGSRVCVAGGDAGYPDRLVFHSTVLNKEIVLRMGEFSEPAAPGSASRNSVKIIDVYPAGIIDGREMRILVLSSATGGSGSYTEIALMAHGDGAWKITDSLMLGDRVRVEGVQVIDFGVAVKLLVHGEHDPMCCPREQSTRNYRIHAQRLLPAESP